MGRKAGLLRDPPSQQHLASARQTAAGVRSGGFFCARFLLGSCRAKKARKYLIEKRMVKYTKFKWHPDFSLSPRTDRSAGPVG
jgi:hypothetical protein